MSITDAVKEWFDIAYGSGIVWKYNTGCCVNRSVGVPICRFITSPDGRSEAVDASSNHYCTEMKMFCKSRDLDYLEFRAALYSQIIFERV